MNYLIRNIKFLYMVLLFSICTTTLSAYTYEFTLQIVDANNNPIAVTINIYRVVNGNAILYSSGTSHSYWKYEINTPSLRANAACDIDDSNTSGAEFGPLERGFYYIVINNKTMSIETAGPTDPTGDFKVRFDDEAAYTLISNNYPTDIRLNLGDWSIKNVSIKNSFNDGDVFVDNIRNENIGTGITKTFASPSFPHNLLAIDNQTLSPTSGTQKFIKWSDDQSLNDQNLSINITSRNAIYTANFDNYFNLSVENNVRVLGNVGNINIDGQIHNMPFFALEKKDNQITISSTDFEINGIKYELESWSTGSTYYSINVNVNSHNSITANYIGVPILENLRINSDEPGSFVRLDWDEHQNPNVTQYAILRGAKVEGNFTNPILLGQVNRGTTTYRDYDYIISGSNPNSVAYSVVAFYSLENSWGRPGMNIVSATQILAKDSDSTAITKTNEIFKLSNNPNPFNPSTNINYTIPEAGLVKLQIYNLLGQKVIELVNNKLDPGNYSTQWNGKNKLGQSVNSGIYFSVLESKNKRIVQKMILAK